LDPGSELDSQQPEEASGAIDEASVDYHSLDSGSLEISGDVVEERGLAAPALPKKEGVRFPPCESHELVVDRAVQVKRPVDLGINKRSSTEIHDFRILQ
jgi:hypothetical protein